MQEKVSRRFFLKKTTGVLLTAIGLSAGGYLYARKIEPKLVDINKKTMMHTAIPAGFNGLKIVQFSDLHMGFNYTIGDLNSLVKKINRLDPDIILFTGDLVDKPNQYEGAEALTVALEQLHANVGKYAIYGNHDRGGWGSSLYSNIMEGAGFTLLVNDVSEITIDDGTSIYIAGVDDALLGRPNIHESIYSIPRGAFTILLSHCPDLADEAKEYDIHYQLSGHSHGGQVRIPFVGSLVTPPYAEKYDAGKYNVDGLTLYVNRGIGTARLPFRFLCRPEVTVFTLDKK
ncbi:metallophosphoesterase [Jeotgalibacillus marinus]|uniref:Metallophosphoesterase n=1 Tax=Jeotgalibacillus marinus TaxID=86667 RepID=A0ABV3PZM5_9BACL